MLMAGWTEPLGLGLRCKQDGLWVSLQESNIILINVIFGERLVDAWPGRWASHRLGLP